ncbi:type VI secretion system tube protein Hcp, partial [bacterium]|nr:type VI secretion system tube protein Hcp [bacterium]
MHRHHVRTALAALAAALLLPAIAARAGDLFLYAENHTWGHIQGDATAPGHGGWIEGLSFQHAVSLPIGPNGVPNGPARTTPLTITTAL